MEDCFDTDSPDAGNEKSLATDSAIGDTANDDTESETAKEDSSAMDSDPQQTDDVSSDTTDDDNSSDVSEDNDASTGIDTEDGTDSSTHDVPLNRDDACCGDVCANCEQRGEICEVDTGMCVPTPCTDDGDCISDAFVCNDEWCHCAIASCKDQPDMTRCELINDPYPESAYDICIKETCVSPGCGDMLCNVPGPYFLLPDTNQRSCYDDTSIMICPTYGAYYGQDAHYGWDQIYKFDRRFSRTATDTPVVTDSVTGLMWQGCQAGRSGPACTEGGWADYEWFDALKYCEELNWAGYSDWRLPDRYAAHSISDANRINPAVDPEAFPHTNTGYTLTSSSVTLDYVWVHSDSLGGMYIYGKDVPFSVRCVRGDSAVPPKRVRSITMTSDPVVEDTATGLAWQGCAAGLIGDTCEDGEAERYSWEDALEYCDQLTWGGLEEWRLPNKIELDSIVVSNIEPLGIDAGMFPNLPEDWFWSSTTYFAETEYAWGVYAASGSVHHFNLKTDAFHVVCVMVN